MRAFQHRDFRIFFIGAVVSNSGSWLQNLAVPYVLFRLTRDPFWVGLAGFAQFIPSFILGPVGGALADRQDRRRVLLIAQSSMAVAAFALWAVWALGWHDRWLILGIVAITGVISGLMVPSWQSFVPLLVPRDDLASAITLNSTQFNAARAVGPALAGFLLATGGPALAFFLNGVSFIAVIVAIVLVNPPGADRSGQPRLGMVKSFTEGLAYMRRRTGLMLSVVCAMLVGFFGNPITQFSVVFAEDVYGAGPKVLGALAAGVGIGAVLVAPALSTWDTRVARSTVVRWALPGYALAVIAFGLAPSWPLGLLALLFVGAGFLSVIATTNTAIQMIVADEMRGRVMSVRVMGFTLSFPLGSLAQGTMASAIDPQTTVVVFGTVLLAAAGILWLRPLLLASLDAETDAADR